MQDDKDRLLELALKHIAESDPGPQSDQTLAHDMALVARQATEQAQAEIDRLRGEVDQVLANAIDRCSKSPEGLRNAVLALGIGEARALLAKHAGGE